MLASMRVVGPAPPQTEQLTMHMLWISTRLLLDGNSVASAATNPSPAALRSPTSPPFCSRSRSSSAVAGRPDGRTAASNGSFHADFAPEDGAASACPQRGDRSHDRRSWKKLAELLGLALAAIGVLPGAALAVDRVATPSTFASVFAASTGGDTIRLASGDYGVFRGGLRSGRVTITAQTGATPVMQLNFNPASNIAIDGLKITDAQFNGAATKNITVRNSTFDGAQVVFRTGALVNANILFDNNVHSNFVKCSGCYEGRIELAERTDQPDGITIQNSRFYGGNSDGIQNGGNATQILNNEFFNIRQIDSAAGVHADSIQLYGSKNTLIKGNYFHDVAVGIMCADGCDHEVIEDNVFAVNGSPYAMTLLSDNGSVIRHNTFLDDGLCDFKLRCGVLYLGNKQVDPISRGTIVINNIIGRVCVCAGTASGLAEEYDNLFTESSWNGRGDLLGGPTYTGGQSPTSRVGFALTSTSLGRGSASEGLDRGVRFAAPPLPFPSPTPTPATNVPVASYGFEEASGSTVTDSSDNANTATIVGATRTTSGKYGRALSFDGVNDYVTVPDAPSLDLTTGMTLEAWLYPTAGGTAWRQAVLKETGGGLAYGLYAFDNNGRPSGFLRAGSEIGSAGSSVLPLNTWSHLAATYDATTLRVFVNGNPVSERSVTGPIATSGSPLKIGGNAIWGEFFKGRIDNVRVYNRALTSQDLKIVMSNAT